MEQTKDVSDGLSSFLVTVRQEKHNPAINYGSIWTNAGVPFEEKTPKILWPQESHSNFLSVTVLIYNRSRDEQQPGFLGGFGKNGFLCDFGFRFAIFYDGRLTGIP